MVFNIAVSNTDDHLRNHGFLFGDGGWLLSPAYDINPVTPAQGLRLNITDDDNSLDYALALTVIDFFQLTQAEADTILTEVREAVSNWQGLANEMGINRIEQTLMAPAFNV